MKVHEFKGLVQHIRNSYGKPMLSEEIQTFLSEQIKHVPSEAVPWIRDQFLRRYPKCPDVLHLPILDLWRAWRAEHPEKCAGEPGARDCGNANCCKGWMIFWRREGEEERLVSFAVPCRDCRRSGNTSLRAYTLEEAIGLGWEPDGQEIRKLALDECAYEAQENRKTYQTEGRRQIAAK